MSHGNSMSRLDSPGNEGDSLVKEIIICTTSIACAEFNMGLIFLWDKGARDRLLHSFTREKPFPSGLDCC